MSIIYKGAKSLKLTPTLAATMNTMPVWKGERKLSPRRMEFLRQQLHEGRFISPRWATVSVDGGPDVRMNGQHSSTVLAEATPAIFPKGLTAIIDQYTVDREDELATLFDTFDRPESTRSFVDAMKAHTAVEDSLKDMSPTRVATIVGGILFAQDPSGDRTTRTNRLAAVHTHKGDIQKITSVLINHEHLRRVCVIAAIYQSLVTAKAVDGHEAAAYEFWGLVGRGDEPVPHPTRALYEVTRTLHALRHRRHSRRDEAVIYVKCVRAWNAWRNLTPITMLRATDADLRGMPEMI